MTLSQFIGHIPVAAKDCKIVCFLKLACQASQNNKKSPFLIGTSPWLRWVYSARLNLQLLMLKT
jgi:hypothetical protein